MLTCSFSDKRFRNIDCVVAIGVFDGVHQGHAKIMERTVEISKKLNCNSVVLSFNVNPKMAKGTEIFCKPLTTAETFEKLIAKPGVDYNCVIDFSDNISKLNGEEFIELLCTSYRVRAMVIGKDFRCGNPSASAGEIQIKEYLSRYSPSAFVEVVDSVLLDGETVSSTIIRRCLLTGDVEKASAMLGRAYAIEVKCMDFTEKNGRLFYDVRTSEQLLPKEGTYRVKATGKAAGALNSVPKETDALAVISEDYLALDLPVRMKPDTIFFL